MARFISFCNQLYLLLAYKVKMKDDNSFLTNDALNVIILLNSIGELFQGKKIASPQTPMNTGFKRAEKVENSKEIQQELGLSPR